MPKNVLSSEQLTKSISNKLSPFGNPINKNLLTPCRQVGLSRKRKTPNSSMSSLLVSPTISSSVENFNTTPVNHRKNASKLETRSLSFSSPNTSLLENSPTPLNSKNSEINKKVASKDIVDYTCNKSAKKTLVHTFSDDLSSTFKKNEMDEGQDLASVLQVDKVSKENRSQILNDNGLSTDNINYCSDDDFKATHENSKQNKAKSKRKCKDIEKTKQKRTSLATESSDSHLATGLKRCQVSIEKISEEDIEPNAIKANLQKNKENYSSDDDFVVAKRKKIQLIDSEDSDFKSTPESLDKSDAVIIQTQAIVHSCTNTDLSIEHKNENNTDKMAEITNKTEENKIVKSKTKVKKQGGETEKTNTFIKCDSKILNITDMDDDDDFTSTPEREKSEKNKLIEKIKSFENQIKQKRKKLENLQQAAIYKSKHDIEELKALTETWRKGCIVGLNGLLTHLQQNGPIDMETLLYNLHIPLDIAKSKIKIAFEP